MEPINRNSYSKPLLSIITVTYNCEEVIEATIKSILRQRHVPLEYIVIDGASRDRTLEILEKYRKDIDVLISEPDEGIYHAMNKGISHSKGYALMFINAGDILLGALNGEAVKNAPVFIPVFYSNFLGQRKKLSYKNPGLGMPYCHQGMIFRNKGRKYNLRFKVAGDFEYYMRTVFPEKPIIFSDSGFVYYDNSGFSQKNLLKRDYESLLIINRYLGTAAALIFFFHAWVKVVIKILYGSYRKIIKR